MGRKAQKNDSLPGSLDMLILVTLSLRDLHGYGIVQFIQQSATLSNSSLFLVLPVIGRTCSRDFSLGRGGLLQ